MRFHARVLFVVLAVCCACEGEAPSPPYKMVDELMAGDLSQWKGKRLKVHGWVLAGSIREQVVGQELQRSFVLHKSDKKIRVFGFGPKPDTFKDQSEIVVSGRLVLASEKRAAARSLGVTLEADAEYALDASNIDARCSSEYARGRLSQDLGKKFE